MSKRFAAALALCTCLVFASPSVMALTLTVERSTGEAWIENLADQTAIFDGYQITSLEHRLDPAGWRSFEDWTEADAPAARATLGNFSWGEFVANPDSLVETNLANETTANPGFRAFLGRPVTEVVEGDLSFYFSDFTKPAAQRNTLGELRIIDLPEPAAGLLALWALPMLLIARRRASRTPAG